MQPTPKNNDFMVVLTNHLSKWTVAEPILDKNAATIAAFLLRIVLQFGCPNITQRDQSLEFNNALNDVELRKLLNMLNVENDSRLSSTYAC